MNCLDDCIAVLAELRSCEEKGVLPEGLAKGGELACEVEGRLKFSLAFNGHGNADEKAWVISISSRFQFMDEIGELLLRKSFASRMQSGFIAGSLDDPEPWLGLSVCLAELPKGAAEIQETVGALHAAILHMRQIDEGALAAAIKGRAANSQKPIGRGKNNGNDS